MHLYTSRVFYRIITILYSCYRWRQYNINVIIRVYNIYIVFSGSIDLCRLTWCYITHAVQYIYNIYMMTMITMIGVCMICITVCNIHIYISNKTEKLSFYSKILYPYNIMVTGVRWSNDAHTTTRCRLHRLPSWIYGRLVD